MTTKKSAAKVAKKTYPTKSGKRSATPPSRRWSAKVTTDSTKPAPGIFNKSAKEIAENLASKSVSPEGPGQGMRMLSFYENRAGKNLSKERIETLERAKDLLRKKEGKTPLKKSAKKSGTTKAAKPAVKKSTKSTRKASR